MGNIVVIGCLEETLDTLSFFYHLGGSVDAVVTLPEKVTLDAGSTNWADLKPFAREHNLPLHMGTSYSMDNPEDFKLIRKLDPVIMPVVGWQRLVPDSIISLAPMGCVGFHGSANFLPWGRGRSPINWSIIEGRNRFILHMIQLAPGVDDGDIIGFEVYDIQPEDTCRSVYYKTSMTQARLLRRFLPLILKGICPHSPQAGEPFYYPKRTSGDGLIDWKAPAEQVNRLVRAVTFPYPGAFTYLNGKRVNIWESRNFGDNLLTADAKPGEVVFVSSNHLREAVVQTGKGALLVTSYESEEELKTGNIFDE